MIVAAMAALGFAGTAAGQKDAAEKAKEGGIEHWIEYYKAQRSRPAAVPAQASAPAPAGPAPAGRTGSGPSARDGTRRE